MAELGLDLRPALPRLLTAALAQEACLLVTMGSGQLCPAVPAGLRGPRLPAALHAQVLGPPAEARHHLSGEAEGAPRP